MEKKSQMNLFLSLPCYKKALQLEESECYNCLQENYINYRPSAVSKDDNGIKRMELIARTAESIADGDIINVQIRRHRQWQLSQSSCIASCVIP